MEVLEAIRNRRSVRQYKVTQVDDEVVECILEAARWAPSWSNSQCWRFIVVRESRIKSELSELLSANNPATDAVERAPVVIVVCAELEKAGYFSKESGKPVTDKGGYWYMFDVALAMQNLVLAAHSLGLGTVYIGAFNARKAADVLVVAPGFCVVAMTPLGYPTHAPATRPRKELSEIVFRDRFGSA